MSVAVMVSVVVYMGVVLVVKARVVGNSGLMYTGAEDDVAPPISDGDMGINSRQSSSSSFTKEAWPFRPFRPFRPPRHTSTVAGVNERGRLFANNGFNDGSVLFANTNSVFLDLVRFASGLVKVSVSSRRL